MPDIPDPTFGIFYGEVIEISDNGRSGIVIIRMTRATCSIASVGVPPYSKRPEIGSSLSNRRWSARKVSPFALFERGRTDCLPRSRTAPAAATFR
jgi:hypothetical protein